MWISRLRVTGGFLADLDLSFGKGLNVIVGPRGAGKTTLLELLRHALGVQHADRSRAEQQAKFVRALLGSGEVVLDVEGPDGSIRVVVDAEGGGRRPELASAALMLGQNELETIASDAQSRLNLIDLRAQVREMSVATEELTADTVALASLRGRLELLDDAMRQRGLLEHDLGDLRLREAELLASATVDLTAKRAQLAEVEARLLLRQTEQRQAGEFQMGAASVEARGRELALEIASIALLPLSSGLIQSTRPDVQVLGEAVEIVVSTSEAVARKLAEARALLQSEELALRSEAEPLRAELDEAERGLGEVTARIRNLTAQLSEIERLQGERSDVLVAYSEREARRQTRLAEAEGASEAMFNARQAVATEVSAQLDSRVVVAVEHLADSTAFRELLVRALQRSNLQYRSVAEAISQRLLPIQLLQFLETSDVSGLVQISGLNDVRASRVVAHLQTPEFLAELAGCALEDRVDFLLRDGTTTKSVETLSTGQKCAVTLPILLTEHTRTLVLDQPEDHLDNAYLVDNIVRGLTTRSLAGAQTIIATHNANIPVLGEAEQVASLRSDGSRGFVHHAGAFDVPEIVTVITTLMEGGIEAFERRARFYSEHGQSS